uniref:Ubiquitin-like domain-containing protein n=1 Tax=Clytia hemisphaerica TaxID=252671 RepID=A0A7M5XC84_9CNID
MNVMEYHSIRSIRQYIEIQYKVRRNDQILLFKGEEIRENQSLLSLMTNGPLDDFPLNLVVVNRPFTVRVRRAYERYSNEFGVEVLNSNTIGEVKVKIAERNGIPLQYVKISSDADGKEELKDDSKLIEDCGLELYPIIWMKPVLRIHVTFVEFPIEHSTDYEILEEHSKLKDVIKKIRKANGLKKIEIRDADAELLEPNVSLLDVAEIHVQVHNPLKKSCIVM